MSIKKFIAFSLVSALLLTGIVTFFYRVDEEVNISNIEYINSRGWQVKKKCSNIFYFKIPEEFDAIFSAYNDIVKHGGFDLTPYKGSRAVRYSYISTDSSASNPIYINIIRCDEEIISADISSFGPDGFIRPLTVQN